MNKQSKTRQTLINFLKFESAPPESKFNKISSIETDSFTRHLIKYESSDGDQIPAFLFVPKGEGPFPGVVVFHQHAGERHLGKSEVAGLKGDPYQAFGPALAEQGFVVLAPDSICFEDRRTNQTGTEPAENEDDDWLQHFNQMAYGILRGESLMTKVLNDSSLAISVLEADPRVKNDSIGVLGHSYGGNTVLFLTAVDDRIAFAVSSGAACSYRHKMEHGTGIEFAMVIPDFVSHFDIEDLVSAASPRRFLLVSATEDIYSMDADEIFRKADEVYESVGAKDRLEHKRFEGGHALSSERFDFIVDWLRSAS